MDDVIELGIAELVSLSTQAGDVLLAVDADGVLQQCSEPTVRVGVLTTEVFEADDAPAIGTLLGQQPAGPAWVRIRSRDGGSAWFSVTSTPREGGGWLLMARPSRQLDPTLREKTGDSSIAADREQVLNEVAWLLSATPRTGKEIAVASCDLDDLGYINDTYGREAGDEVLRIVTGRISDALRSGDLVARLEDDQLLVVLRGVHHLRGAIRVANKIRAAVEDPISMPFGEIVQTVSVGVTLISRGESVDSVLERAEGAMEMAKERGSNTVMSSPPI